MSRLFQRGWTHQSTPHTCRAVAQLTVSFLKQSKRTYTQLLKEKGENTSWVGEEEYVREPWGERTGWGGSVKGGQRQQQQTERKQEEAAKSVDVVLSSSFCRLVLFLHSKIHYYITPSMGNFPELTRSLWARLAYLFYCWLQRYSSLAEHHSKTYSVSLQTEKQTHAAGTKSDFPLFLRNVFFPGPLPGVCLDTTGQHFLAHTHIIYQFNLEVWTRLTQFSPLRFERCRFIPGDATLITANCTVTSSDLHFMRRHLTSNICSD